GEEARQLGLEPGDRGRRYLGRLAGTVGGGHHRAHLRLDRLAWLLAARCRPEQGQQRRSTSDSSHSALFPHDRAPFLTPEDGGPRGCGDIVERTYHAAVRIRPTVHEYWTSRRPDLGETLLKRGVLIFRTASCFSRTGIRGFPRVHPPRCVVRLGRERMGRSVMGGKYRGGIASGMQPRLGLFAALACLGALPMACDDDKKDNANDPAT